MSNQIDDDDRADELRDWYAEDNDDQDGAELLDELRDTLTRYVAFATRHAAVAVTLWITATHALPAFECAPRLVVTSPQKRCGKTRLLDVIEYTCHAPLATVDATVAAVFRSLGGEHPPTLIVDEADAMFGNKKVAEQNEDLRKLLNAGHQRGRTALRCVGPSQIPTRFNTFAMVVLAGIGDMPDTITDRAINISMRRRAPGERVSQFRSRRDGQFLEELRNRLADWTAGLIKELTDAEPDMPVEDRAADTWEPLIAVADAAGGHWPDTARSACKVLVDAAESADENGSLAVKLLTDIRQVFTDKGATFLPSADLVGALRGIDESPWDDFELNARKLARRLKEFGVSSVRNPAGTVRGYRLEDLSDAFSRYMRQEASEPSETANDEGKLSDTQKPSDTSIRQTENIRQTESAGQHTFLTVLTDTDAIATETGSPPTGFTPPTGPGRCNECGWHTATQCHKPGCGQTVLPTVGVRDRRTTADGKSDVQVVCPHCTRRHRYPAGQPTVACTGSPAARFTIRDTKASR